LQATLQWICLLHFQFSFWDSGKAICPICGRELCSLSILFLRFPNSFKPLFYFFIIILSILFLRFLTLDCRCEPHLWCLFQFSFWDSLSLSILISSLTSSLSILFLRFKTALRVLLSNIKEKNFQFSFWDSESLLIEQGEKPENSFNSLFEIRTAAMACHTLTVNLSILFLRFKRSLRLQRVILLSLSILFLRFIKPLSPPDPLKFCLSILFLRFRKITNWYPFWWRA